MRPRLGQPSHAADPARPWRIIGPVSVFLVIALLSTLLFGAFRGRDRLEKREEFILQAQQVAFAVETHFGVAMDLLGSVAALFLSSAEVSRQEFATFVRPIVERHPSIYAFEWMPMIRDSARDSLETVVRAEGFPEFRVQQKDAEAKLIAAERRPDYLPILYMEPLEPVVLGLDVTGNPERGDESFRARDSGSPTASERYSLIEDPHDVFSVIGYEPVFKQVGGSPDREFLGLVAVLLRLDAGVREAIAGGGTEGIHVLLRDESAPEGKQVLFSSSIDKPGLDLEAAWTREFSFADRRYSIRMAPLPGSSWAQGRGPVALWVAGILLGVAAAFASGALLQIGQLRKRVDEAMELGQYRLGRRLGEGGMGIVYQAEHRMLARPAAIKLIRPNAKNGADGSQHRLLMKQFEREAKATAALHSAHTIKVYDFGHTDRGEFYYVMELLNGLDLETLVEHEGPIEPSRVTHILRQACHSLAEAHSAGLVHRDIKPANIYLCHHGLEYDFVKILDFGLVRSQNYDGGTTALGLGAFAGTPAFCAPETAARAADVDARSDIYSLGCVAYWLLTGRTVFDGKTPIAMMVAHVDQAPRAPSALSELDIPEDLESIVMWCLQKRPDDRPRDAPELERRLAACSQTSAWTQHSARRWWESHHPGGIRLP